MNGALRKRLSTCAAAWVFGWMAASATAEVFFVGPTKGMAGDEIELAIIARAGTVLSSINIVPEYEEVAGVLALVSFLATPALTDGGSGLCFAGRCTYYYVPEKSFSGNAVLATLRFKIDPDAQQGPIDFDLGVVVGIKSLRLPEGAGFEVLAVPEPSTWALLLVGLMGVAGAALRKRAA